MDRDEIVNQSRRVELDMTAGIIENTLDQHSVEYSKITPLYQYNKVAVHGVSTTVTYEVTHTLLDYDIILESVSRVKTCGSVNLFFRQVSIEQVDVTVTENHIVPEL